ncbi:unnamed protein product [Paramecium octaurelia]|uniref:Transmembrane protein n=1 Tax=Paramecium octaurelia TaxID=43137 RepID=A0A8S1V311_PAROT|nr:unnamed protein product [Paramecium octaurelia]
MCEQFLSSCYILEGDEEDYQKLDHINTQVVQKSFQIPYQQEPILIRVINSLNQTKIQEKLMCSLFVNLQYYITCMVFDLILYEEQTNYSELIRMETKILANELCDELFTNDDGSLSLFCLSQTTLKQYSLHFQSNIFLIFEHNVSDQIQDQCKKKLIKFLNSSQYISVFYQCQRWKIMFIKNNQAKTILDAQMKNQDVQLLSLSYIDDISFCEHNDLASALYLIENNFYLYVNLNSQEAKILNYILIYQANRIQKLIMQQRCEIIIQVINGLNKSDSSLIQNEITQHVILNQQYPFDNINFHSNLIFLQNKSELIVLINVNINQTYQICNSSLYFFDFDNLFCQYDWANKVLQFYKYQPLSDLIKPKQKYIYVVQKKNLFKTNAVINCYRIIYKNNTQKQIQEMTELMILENNCQIKQQIVWKFNYPNYFTNSTYSLQSSEGSLKVSIAKYQVFQHNCLTRLYKQYLYNKIQLKEIIDQYICFQYESFFYIYNCKQNQFQVSINLDQYYVLESKMAFYFVNRNNTNVLRGVQFFSKSLQNFNVKLNGVFTSFQQIHQNLFFYTNSSNLPLLIIMNQQQASLNNYLSKNLYQPEPILYYVEIGNLKFIQYAKTLAIQNKENLRCFQFADSIIIYIQPQNLISSYLIVAIQNSTRSLILHYFHDQELHQIQNYTLQNYSFYYPFKYTTLTGNLAILIEQNSSLNIAIFQYNNYQLILKEIIETDDFFFKFHEQKLFYSFEKVWRYSFFNQFLVDISMEKIHQNVLTSYFSMSNKKEGAIDLKIQVENHCFQLHSLMKSPIINIQNNKGVKLNVSEMFYGPISNLTLLDNSKIILKGPIQIKQDIQECNFQTSTFCIRGYHFKEQMFTVFVEENYILEVITINSINNYYITWIKQEYFLCVSLQFDFLNIELIECSEKENKNCQMISNVNHDVKIKDINISKTIRVGNLIILKGDKYTAFIFIEDLNFQIQMLPDKTIDIQYIEESNNQYLILQNSKMDSDDLEITIYSINLNQKQQIYSLVINEKMQAELINFRNYAKSEFLMKLVQCKYSGDLIYIKLFIMNYAFSQLLQLNLDLQKNQIQLKQKQQFRNFNIRSNQGCDLQYLDDTLLVLKQKEDPGSQFYQHQENGTFYDYFHKLIFQMQIKRLNTTHYIFFNSYQVQLGLIEYELELQNYDDIEQNFQLFAQNQISNEKISLQIHIIKTSQQLKNSILIIQIFCFLFILIYPRTTKYKLRNQNC